MTIHKPKKILVTGGAGFVGSHLCDCLVGQGHYIICWDNLSTGSRKNIAHLLKKGNFRFARRDVAKSKFITVDEIYHLASPASPVHYQRAPLRTFEANVIGTKNLLELARKNNAKFLFASTSEVYGDPLVNPQKESYWGNVNPVGIRSCYDESKRAGETLCADYHRVYNLPIKIVRIFNTYGPRMTTEDGRVVSNFIVQALKEKPLTVYGSGKQTRSFQYVDDLITGLVKMMSAKNFIGPVNLGNPREFTVRQLAKLVIRLTKSGSRITHRPLPSDDPKQRKPGIILARKKLNWQPEIKLEEGLSRTIDYFQKTL